MPTGLTKKREKQISEIVDELRKKERYAFRYQHGKADLYRYLDGVIEESLEWDRKKVSRGRARDVSILYSIKPRKGKSPVHVLLEATSPGHKGTTRTRWVKGIQFVLTKKTSYKKDPKKFWDKYGGIKGCADLAAKRPYKRKRVLPKGQGTLSGR